MPLIDLGTVLGKNADCAVRWDESTGTVELFLYQYPLEGSPGWAWIKIGIARSPDIAIMTANNWLRGE